MNYLSIENLTKTYGEKTLFKNISFGIEQGQKLALIAKNGSGKSTLLKIICGKDIPDSGNIVSRNGISIAYLDQDPQFDEQSNVIENIFRADNPILKIIKEYEFCLEEVNLNPSAENLEKLQQISAQMDDAAAWDYDVKVKQILFELKVTNLHQAISETSGGQRKRVALSRVLIEAPDLLIMDEPTNHLDLAMVEWLENYLARQDMALLMVTHDRYFLDNVCDEIIELDNHQLYRYKGNYSYFLEKKAEREFNEGRETDKARNLMRTEIEWMRRMPKARGTKSKARIDAFYDLKDKAAGKAKQQALQLNVKMNRIGGKVIELKKLYKNFGDLKVVKGFDYTFKTGERIGIVGKNGVGKSTFLNMLMGIEQADSGKINVGETVVFGYYSQQGMILNEDKRVIEVVKEIADVIPMGDGSKITASQFLQLFQFPPDSQYTYVSKLSGGEKRRLYLLTVLMKNPNFLILDEPTNDLDLLTLNTLEDFLLNFKGCLLIVSHDRYFMDKLVDSLFVFEGEGIISGFTGNYAEYRDKQEELERIEKENSKLKNKSVSIENAEVPSNIAASEKKNKLSFKEKYELEQLEKEIPVLEKEKEQLTEKMNIASGNHLELQQAAERFAEVSNLLDEKSMRWLELSELVE
ncbi:MAG TPA: ABC-F family ATP-binding cassette domain-containing protein [Bacteroidia bacterium]|nr:ABC-F family ATP-binding cassette domain-containing protein [Bacteroidia bacterium]HRH08309.1 ABC-F family ATP-binding cassette domain-containing protein [Bacteroidia bacterium]